MTPNIRGLQYIPEYLNAAAHDRLLAEVDAQTWLTSVDHRVQIDGYNYSHANRAVFRTGDVPAWVSDLAVRLCDDGLLPEVPDQMVANDYPPGSGIFPHIDQAVFGDVVASVSLGSTCVMRFSHGAFAQTEELLLSRGACSFFRTMLAGPGSTRSQHEPLTRGWTLSALALGVYP